MLLNFEGDIPQRDLNQEEKYCWSEKDIFLAISEKEYFVFIRYSLTVSSFFAV